jgi:hypothetical protein
MSVITTDILLEGYRRKQVFEWMSAPENHNRMLVGAFSTVTSSGDNSWDVMVEAKPMARPMGYHFDRADSSHRGRRILCRTSGKRTLGKLNYSLRTPRGTSHTLVTLHADYDPGRFVGRFLDGSGLRTTLEGHYRRLLQTLGQELGKDLG